MQNNVEKQTTASSRKIIFIENTEIVEKNKIHAEVELVFLYYLHCLYKITLFKYCKLMRYTYKTEKTCSTEISLDISGDVVTGVSFVGGCHGNLQAVPRLVEGLTVSQITEKLKGIDCRGRGTSCADQLVCAVNAAYEAEQKYLAKDEA